MIISSAYIFAKQIKAIDVPMPADVYFENGRFNPLYVGSDFDFSDSDIKHGNTYSEARTAAMYFSDYILPHKVIQAMGPDSGEWIIENGELVRKMSSPYTSSDDNASCVFLPITIDASKITAYSTKINVNITQTEESGWYNSTIFELYVLDARNVLDSKVSDSISPGGSTPYVDYATYVWRRSDQVQSPYYIAFYASSQEEVRIKKIWFTDLNT